MRDLLGSAAMPLLALLVQSILVVGLALLVGRFATQKGAAFRVAVYRSAVASILVLLVAGPAIRMFTRPLVQFNSPTATVVAVDEKSADGAMDTSPRPVTVSPVRTPMAEESRPAIDAAEAFSCIYLLGSATLVAGLFVGSAWLFRLRRNSTPHRQIRSAVTSPIVNSAFVSGVFKPTIFLPADIEARYSADVVDTIVRHETVHIGQHDCLWNLITRLACAASWMSPLSWILAAKLRQESELLCDRLVLESGVEPAVYAGCLVKIAESFASSPADRLVGIGIVNSNSNLSRRISLMLNASSQSGGKVTSAGKRRIASAFALVLLGATMLVSAAPIRRALHDSTPEATITGFYIDLNKDDWQGMITRVEGAKIDLVVPALQKLPRHTVVKIKTIPHILKVSITGDRATVQYEVTTELSNPKVVRTVPRRDTAQLHRVGGDWKINGGVDVHGDMHRIVEIARDPSKLGKAGIAYSRTIVLSNFKRIAVGLLQYIADRHDKYPARAIDLKKELKPYITDFDSAWTDANGKPLDVQFNPWLIGKSETQISDPPYRVLLSLGAKGHLQSIGGMTPIAYCDGHVKMVNPAAEAKLSWK